jgi:pyruvate dehydrogenase E2 component (dihydrolipoamide acetyltransferase)
MVKEIIMPKLGQTMTEGVIVEWLKDEGDAVGRGDVVFTIESDKATLEVEAPGRGYLRKILVPEGETVPVLSVVGLLTREPDEDISGYDVPPSSAGVEAADTEEPSAEEAPAVAASGASASPSTGAVRHEGRIFASPRARRRAGEEGVDIADIKGSGPNGRIVERDVLAYVEALPDATPVAQRLAEHLGVDLRTVPGTGPGGRITKDDVTQAAEGAPAPVAAPALATAAATAPAAETPMGGVRAVIARRMHQSHQATAPVTLTSEVDATEFVALREQLKARLADELDFNIGYNDLLIQVAARALQEFPNVNARLTGDIEGGVIQHLADVHVALAVDTDRGLLVPVIHYADRKGLVTAAKELRQLIEKARAGQAAPDDLSGSTFTITNLGMYDIDSFTPIINLPEVAILGVGRIKDRPAVVDGEVGVRKMMWLSLTFDHRLVDGAPAARFLQRIKELVETPYLLLA